MNTKSKYSKILTKKFLIKEYIKNKNSTLKIAKKLNCDRQSIANYLKKYNIKIRTLSEARQNSHPSYKDGRTLKKYYCKKCNKKIQYKNQKPIRSML